MPIVDDRKHAIPGWEKVCLVAAGSKVVLSLAVYATLPIQLGSRIQVPASVFALLVLVFGLTAGVLFLFSYRDRRALDLGASLLMAGSACASTLLMPHLRFTANYIRPEFFLPYFFWTFATRFPAPRPFEPYQRIALAFTRVSVIVGTVLAILLLCIGLVRFIAGPSSVDWPTIEGGVRSIGWMVVLGLELPALALILRRTRMAPITERRRVRLFVGALVVGILPIALAVAAEVLIPPFQEYISVPAHRKTAGIFIYSSIGMIPLITAYSVLVQRILDVRLIVRKALQYAFARYTLALAAALPLVGLIVFIYPRRSLPMDELLHGPEALVLASTAIAGLVTIKARRKLLDVLDRRFFREQYDARLILARVVEEIRSAGNVEEMGEIVRTQIYRALLPETADTFILEPSTGSFRPLHASSEELPATSDLATLIASGKDPLDTDLEEPDSAVQSLPREDWHWLVTSGVQLVVPIRASADGIHGFIALGRRRNELPYTSEDRLLLTTIAHSAGLVLNGGLSSSPKIEEKRTADAQAVICPTCRIVLPETHLSCTACRGKVEIANVPYILLDKFRLERKIGAGGMGVVYRATDLTLKRTVAVKTLPTVSPEHAIQLRREARAMASVSHPNLALIFGAETWRGQPLLIVEYMNAGTLADRLEFGAMSGPEAVKFGLQMAAVLDHLHAADILHRDIKPSNIGFVAPDIPKLLDFGLAQLLTDPRSIRRAGLEDATTTSTERTVSDYKPGLAGTPAYMSPEVVNGADPDPSVDLWALAMVIYESISLTNPMRKGTVGLTLKEVAAARVPDVRTKAVSCPADIAELLAAALSADIRRRPKTAKDFQRRLESCLSVTA